MIFKKHYWDIFSVWNCSQQLFLIFNLSKYNLHRIKCANHKFNRFWQIYMYISEWPTHQSNYRNSRKLPLFLSSQFPSPLHVATLFWFLLHRLISFFPELHINGIIQYVNFWVWLPSGSFWSSSALLTVSVLDPFYGGIIFGYICTPQFYIQSSVDIHLGCFPFLAVLNTAAINRHLQVCNWVPVFNLGRINTKKWNCQVVC